MIYMPPAAAPVARTSIFGPAGTPEGTTAGKLLMGERLAEMGGPCEPMQGPCNTLHAEREGVWS